MLLPYDLFQSLQGEFKQKLAVRSRATKSSYVPFIIEDYVDNPVALARLKAGLSQSALARRMDVTQAYISKIERKEKVSAKVFQKVQRALK